MGTLEETIAILKEERRITIAAFQFQKAKEIDKRIAVLKSRLAVERANAKIANYSREFEAEKEVLRHKALELQANYEQLLLTTRATFEAGLTKFNESYTREMNKLSTDYAKALELEAIRPVPPAIELRRTAKLQADICCSWELAEEMYSESASVSADSVHKREEEVRRLFDAKQASLRAAHRLELAAHDERMNTEIALLRFRFEQELNVLKQGYGVYATKFKIPWTPADVDGFFRPYGLEEGGKKPGSPPRRSRSGAGIQRSPPSPSSPSRSSPTPSSQSPSSPTRLVSTDQ
jgi:hypothetical protein